MLIRARRGIAAAWLIGAALAAAPLGAQPGGADPRLTPAPGIKVDADYMIGVWSDHEDCSDRIEFRRDGVFVNSDRTQGQWRVEGDTLTLSGRGSVTVRIVPHGRDEITVVNPDGSLGYSRRCPGPLTAAAAEPVA